MAYIKQKEQIQSIRVIVFVICLLLFIGIFFAGLMFAIGTSIIGSIIFGAAIIPIVIFIFFITALEQS